MNTSKNVPSLENATGKVKYTLTNDILFHIVLQDDDYALKGLIASLLHMEPSDIKKTKGLNPILPGDPPDAKLCILDIYVLFNDNSYINLEMQVEDQKNWVPRSLTYLSREFDQLKHGDDYTLVKPVYHVGFLNFTLFEDHPEFHATYRLQNVRDGYTYTDKFSLHVLELNHINLATDEDRYYKTDKWAALFKATSWEEIKMLAQENDYIMSAAKSMYSSVTDPRILKLCTRRQEEIDGDNHRRERLAEQEKQITEQEKQITEQKTQIAKQSSQIAEQSSQIAELTADNLALKQEIAEIKAMLSK